MVVVKSHIDQIESNYLREFLISSIELLNSIHKQST